MHEKRIDRNGREKRIPAPPAREQALDAGSNGSRQFRGYTGRPEFAVRKPRAVRSSQVVSHQRRRVGSEDVLGLGRP
jgi:hypothetical protein